MDKRRSAKQLEGNPGGDSDADEVRCAFHAIDMSTGSAAPPTGTRRASRSASHGAARAESWMARVSTAMSHRIFSGGSGGKKLSGSRSTQVMPMQPPGGHDGGSDTASGASSRADAAGLAVSSSQDSFLAPAAVKPFAPTASTNATNATTAVVGFEDARDDGVVSIDACPSVACDVESSEEKEEEDTRRRHHRQGRPVDRSVYRRTAERAEWASKVSPNRSTPAFDDDDDSGDVAGPAAGTAVRVSTLVSAEYPRRQHRDRDNDEDGEEQAAAPTPAVLKDFFSRTPSVGVEIRDQQRRARREAHYRRIRERQDELRGRLERENTQTAEESATDSDRRRLKAQQLRRLSVARRLELRREAAAARDQVLTRVREQDERTFRSAREHWERDFQDEIRALSDAFRRARARNQCTRSEADAADGEPIRPMTVAGLVVPEALSEIRHGMNNADKRVKSAGDSPSPTRLKAAAHRIDEARGRTPTETLEDTREVLDVLGAVSNSSAEEEAEAEQEEEEEEEEEQEKEEIEGLLAAADDMEGVIIDLRELLDERERLLQRVADIDRLVDVQRRLGLLSDP